MGACGRAEVTSCNPTMDPTKDTKRTGRFNKRNSVSVISMEMYKDTAHNTSQYVNTTQMVARRGQSFDMGITFSNPVDADKFMMEFKILLRITPPPHAFVGKYEAVVAMMPDTAGAHYARDKAEEFYLLFNPWCPSKEEVEEEEEEEEAEGEEEEVEEAEEVEEEEEDEAEEAEEDEEAEEEEEEEEEAEEEEEEEEEEGG
ncbi:hypothetical protein CRUP_021902 [Coryphaenoides rupestris]|nr:hypothetical protein CRUP_021902 [Coryphaenoides rupestris]